MKGMKKKFLDILFENDDDYVIEEEQEEDKPKVKKDNKAAKEVLYRKPKQSAFINLDENPVKQQQSQQVKTNKNEYEFSSQISPIFGMSNESKNKTIKLDTDDSLTTKPENSHLDIITSPIYGYGEQISSNYLPSEIDSFSNYDESDFPSFEDYSIKDEQLEIYDFNTEQNEEIYEYEELTEHLQNDSYIDSEQHEEYMGYYRQEYSNEQDDLDYISDDYDIPYYDEEIYSDDYNVENISLFDVEEED